MSNLETIKDVYTAYARGDLPFILSKLAEDVSWESELPAILSFGGIRKGIDGTKGFFAALMDEYSDPKLDMKEFLTSEDAVAAFGRYEATDKATGVRVDSPVAHLFKFRDGKIVRYVNLVNSAAFVEARQFAP